MLEHNQIRYLRDRGLRAHQRVLATLCILLLGSSCATTETVRKLPPREAGEQALEQGRVGDAIAAFEAHLQTAPEDVDALKLLARALMRRGQTERAITAWERVAGAEPEDAEARAAIADGHFALGHWAQARDAYRKAISLGNDDPMLVVRYAECEIQQRRPAMAIGILDTHAAESAVAAVHAVRGRALIAQGKPDEALESLRRAAELDKSDPEPLVLSGRVYEALDFQERAIAAYRRALERQPEHADALGRLAGLLMASGAATEATPLLMRAARVKPQDLSVRNNLGVAYMRSMLYDEAVATFHKALALGPNEPAVHSNLAEAYYLQGNLQGAEEHLRKVLALDPDRADEASALRRIVIMREMVVLQCGGSASPAAIKQQVVKRYETEGWSASQVNPDLAALREDRAALAILSGILERCPAS